MIQRTNASGKLDLAAARARLAGKSGSRYWRSLDELAGTPAFQDYLGQEYPALMESWGEPVGRRRFLQLMGASLALAGVSGCVVQPAESIVPYTQAPEGIILGRPMEFATALCLGGYATGVVVTSHEGRPTKIEGNPDHPASLGATDIYLQAEILQLYDPDRAQLVTAKGRVSTWDDALAALYGMRQEQSAKKGAGLRVLTEATSSPTLIAQFAELKKQLPEARWHVFEPVGGESARAGALMALGEPVETVHHIERADVILSLDANFLGEGPARLRDARAFTARREVGLGVVSKDPIYEYEGVRSPKDRSKPTMNRLYVVEPVPSITGSMADHRRPIAAGRIGAFAQAVAQALKVEGVTAVTAEALSVQDQTFAGVVARDLIAHKGASLVVAGCHQPAEVHALAHAINAALGNVGKTVEYFEPVLANPGGSLAELVGDLKAGKVEALFILGGNPVYSSPVDLAFGKALVDAKVPYTFRLGLHADETSALCHWNVSETHPLETWGDARAFDGTATIQQPLIAPLYDGHSAIEVMSNLLGRPAVAPLALVRETWEGRKLADDFDAFWITTLNKGVVDEKTRPSAKTPTLKPASGYLPKAAAEGRELVFRPDPTIYDGRYANNGWLQELPKPLTSLTWDNVAMMSAATAKELELQTDPVDNNSELVELTYQGQTRTLPIWIVPGHVDGSISVTLGYGRSRSGRIGGDDGAKVGVNVYALRTSEAPGHGGGLGVKKVAGNYKIAATQHHFLIKGNAGHEGTPESRATPHPADPSIPPATEYSDERDIVRTATLGDFLKHPEFAKGHHDQPREFSMFLNPEPQRVRQDGEVGNAWGMAINLNTCIGCHACVVACQAENNIPVVGKQQVLAGREMHWIRVDTYYEGDSPENPATFRQPVTCQHCEKAPCEIVCPVAATTHSAEGLNEMTYNRCVGTRYCGNNCPYKVRRFNFLSYNDVVSASLKLQRNPDVTTRTRGIMEKCTYCVQRIVSARIKTQQDDAPNPAGQEPTVPGNMIATACQQACPTKAIVFGNLNDPTADVVQLKADPRAFALLGELNTQPRTSYLAKITNPNPELVVRAPEHPEHEAS